MERYCDDCGCLEPTEVYDTLEGKANLCHDCAEAGGLLDGDPYTFAKDIERGQRVSQKSLEREIDI